MTDEIMPSEEWKRCKDGALMLKLLGETSGPPESEGRRQLVMAACECARHALPYIQGFEQFKEETRPLVAIETAERWAHGQGVTLEQMRQAAASSAAFEAEVVKHVRKPYIYAIYAAIRAVNSAVSAVFVDNAATVSAAAAASSADADGAAAVAIPYKTASVANAKFMIDALRANVLNNCADIIRKHFPEPPTVAKR